MSQSPPWDRQQVPPRDLERRPCRHPCRTDCPNLGKLLYSPGFRWFGVNRGWGLILIQPMTALDQLHQPPRKAGRRSPVDNIMIEHHRQVEDLARLDPPLNHGWLSNGTPRYQAERIWHGSKPPAAMASAKHTYRGDANRASH
jgi:hypothetical protein